MPDADNKPSISLDDLDKAPDALPASNVVDSMTKLVALLGKFSDVTTENQQLKEDLRNIRASNATRAILDDLIKPFAGNVFKFMCFYSVFVGALLVWDGFGGQVFHLPDGVLQFLVGSTAVTVVGLVGTVVTGIFVGARK